MIVTVIFLPLSLLTGYFGMNFDLFWIKDAGKSDKLYAPALILPVRELIRICRFWAISLPVMAVVIPLFTFPDIRRMVHYLQKRAMSKKVVQVRRHRACVAVATHLT